MAYTDYADMEAQSRTRSSAHYRPMEIPLLHQVLAHYGIKDARLLRSYGMRVRAGALPQKQVQRARQTQDDPELMPAMRRRSRQLAEEYRELEEKNRKSTRKLSSQMRQRGKHPLFWCGLTLLLVVLFWIGSTNGASWYTSHLTDPSTYGPTQGTIIVGVFGGGDSPQKPTKLIALNNDGQIQLIKVTANDPAKGAQLVTGPNLVKQGFPDPTRAKVELKVGDFDQDSKQDVKVTILATMFDFPFHRYQQAIILYGDGKGGLKPRQS